MAMDEAARRNRKHWDGLVRDGLLYTRPWLDLDPELVESIAAGRARPLPEPYIYFYPPQVFAGAAGKDVLCLASGGGQQSAVFGLLGARVTVLDLSEGQLEADRKAAGHYGYDVETVQGDMRDLSAFGDGSFDIVYQAISLVFVPSLGEVYREVHRVLRPGGLYRVGHCNPATQPVEESSWDGGAYRIAKPYRERIIEDAESMEFRHYLSEIFNNLIETGFELRGVWEDPRHLAPPGGACPGTPEHCLEHVQNYFAILARKAF